MVSQHSLSLVYLRVPLSLLALTGCFILAPSQAQAIDDTPLQDRSTDSSIPSQNADGENQEFSTCSGKLRSPLAPLKKGLTEKAPFVNPLRKTGIEKASFVNPLRKMGTEKAPFLRGLGDLNCASSNQNTANLAPSVPQSHGNSDLTAKKQPLANPTPKACLQSPNLSVGAKHSGDTLSITPKVFCPNASPSRGLQTDPRARLQTTLSNSDPPKSPLKGGTLTEFSPLFKGGRGGSPGLQTDPSVASYLGASQFCKNTKEWEHLAPLCYTSGQDARTTNLQKQDASHFSRDVENLPPASTEALLFPPSLAENAQLIADSNLGELNFPLLAQTPKFPSDIQQPLPPQTLPEPPPPAPAPAPTLQLPPPTPTPPEPSDRVPETITIKGFKFEGNTAFSSAELEAAIPAADYINHPIPFAKVFEVRSKITEFYRKNGYVTSGAIIPPQTFHQADGILTVQIVEGGLEAIEVRGTRRLNPNYIRSRIALAVSKPVSQRKLTEALQLLQLDPLIKSISAEITAGTKTAQSLLIVQVEEANTISLSLALDNNRSPTIGTFERRLDFLQANLLGQGDSLAFSYSNTNGSNALDAIYTYPLNPHNGNLSFRTNFTFGHVVESPFDRLDIDANSRYFELSWRQPLIRNLNQEFALGLSATNQRSKVTIFDVPVRLSPGTEEDGSNTVSALRFFQEWTKRSRNQVFALRSQFSLGLGVLGATVNKDAPDSRFLSWRGQTQWVRFLAPDTPLILRGDIQVSTQPLLRLEQYGIGGFDTVRGYRENLFLADNGGSVSAEARFPILRLRKQNGLLQVAPFFDLGFIWNNSGNTDPEPDPNFIASIGLGLRFQLGDRLSARLDWGLPLIDVRSSQTTLQDSGVYFSVNYRIF